MTREKKDGFLYYFYNRDMISAANLLLFETDSVLNIKRKIAVCYTDLDTLTPAMDKSVYLIKIKGSWRV
jgi:hypothetical protein